MKCADTLKGADISPCGKYRFSLSRQNPTATPATLRTVIFILCNPSTATARLDDATVRRGWGFAEMWGYNRMVFFNVNPWRAKHPHMQQMPEPWALELNRSILTNPGLTANDPSALIVAGWGDKALPQLIVAARMQLPESVYHLGTLTTKGNPRHPLYVRKEIPLNPWVTMKMKRT